MADEPKPIPMNYKPNSHRAKDAPDKEVQQNTKKLDKMISGEVIPRKKSLGRKISETFTGDDMHSVGSYILFEVIIPAAKTMLSDAASQGVERMLFGETTRRSRSGGAYRPGFTNYTGVSSNKPQKRELSDRAKAAHDFDDIVLADRGEAETLLDKLTELVNEYGVAQVSDLYDLVGITASFVDNKFGWYDLREARIMRVREGFLIKMPPVSPIE